MQKKKDLLTISLIYLLAFAAGSAAGGLVSSVMMQLLFLLVFNVWGLRLTMNWVSVFS